MARENTNNQHPEISVVSDEAMSRIYQEGMKNLVQAPRKFGDRFLPEGVIAAVNAYNAEQDMVEEFNSPEAEAVAKEMNREEMARRLKELEGQGYSGAEARLMAFAGIGVTGIHIPEDYPDEVYENDGYHEYIDKIIANELSFDAPVPVNRTESERFAAIFTYTPTAWSLTYKSVRREEGRPDEWFSIALTPTEDGVQTEVETASSYLIREYGTKDVVDRTSDNGVLMSDPRYLTIEDVTGKSAEAFVMETGIRLNQADGKVKQWLESGIDPTTLPENEHLRP